MIPMEIKVVFLQVWPLMDNKLKSESGQSTIEFIMTFTAAVGFIFLFLKMAMNYTDGFMVHHATYMAARSYLVDDQERQSLIEGDTRALVKAKTVFNRYMPDGLITGVNANALSDNNPSEAKFPAYVGLYYEFTRKFSSGFIGGKESIRFISEAFLGREPTRSETRTQVCEALKSLGSSCNVHVTLDDNGG